MNQNKLLIRIFKILDDPYFIVPLLAGGIGWAVFCGLNLAGLLVFFLGLTLWYAVFSVLYLVCYHD